MANAKGKKVAVPPQKELDTTVSLRIENSIVRAIDLIARKQRRTRSNVIRLALEDAVRKAT